MRLGLRTLWSVCAAAGLWLSVSACAGQRDQELRLAEDLGRMRAEAAWHAARATELEARLTRLEERKTETPASRASDDRELLNRFARLIALSAHPAPEQPALPAAGEAQTACVSETQSSPEEQIRTLVERLRGHPGRVNGPLTRDQNEALRRLLKPERQLDSDNPWY